MERSGRSVAVSALLALAAGALHAAMFPPLEWGWLAWVALMPLFWGWLGETRPKIGALLGFVFAISLGHATHWWFPDMLHTYFRFDLASAWILAELIGVVAAVPYAVLGAVIVACGRRYPLSAVTLAAGWALTEYVGAQWLAPNRFGLLSHSQAHSSSVQVLDLVGQYGLGFLIALVNGALAVALRRVAGGRVPWLSMATAGAVAMATFAYGEIRLRSLDLPEPSVEVMMVQGGVRHSFFRSSEGGQQSFEKYLQLTHEALEEGPKPDLVFWPEWAVDVYLGLDDEESQAPVGELQRLGTELIVGGPHRSEIEGRRIFFNSAFLVSSRGVEGRYDKLRLLPLAEARSPFSLSRGGRRAAYDPGSVPVVLASRHGGVGVMICSESSDPAVARKLVDAGAEILANPSNDYWLVRRQAMHAQLDLATLRSVESRRYQVRATSTGWTGVINPLGRVESLAEVDEVLTVRGRVSPMTVSTVYQRYGDLVVVLSAFWMLMVWLLARRSGKMRR